MEEKNIEFDFKNLRESVWLQEGQYLSDYNVDRLTFGDGLPEGIFNKKYPGMGATYCEFHSPRPSIIVFPFRKLAYEKADKYKKDKCNTFFVGTDPNNKSTKKYQIKDWYAKNKSKNPKFSVVADSIKKLVEAIQESGIDPFKEFFLVLDEVELLQMQSGFRKALPVCFDYFKKFLSKCLVSATLLNFSDQDINELPIYDLEVYTSKSDELGIPYKREKEKLQIRTFKNDPHVGIANQIADLFQEKGVDKEKTKFLIGLNSLKGINEMIEVFKKRKTAESISVHVSSDSKENFFKKYTQDEIIDGVLPSNINLTSCINWNGVDINENIYAVAISLKTKVHHAFSFENLVQFFGRSRVKESKPPFTFALSVGDNLEFEKPKIPLSRRKEQLKGLIEYVNTKIEEEKDRNDLIQAISNTKSSLIYLNSENQIAVNWLLEDLENYELGKVSDYKEEAKGLITKLEDRYKVDFFDHSKYKFTITPDRKTPEEKEEETLERFLDNLDEEYSSLKLVERFLDQESLQSKRAAAYWYLFGRSFNLSEYKCKELAEEFSKHKKSFQISSIVVEGLRFYTRHKKAFESVIENLYKKRNKQKNMKPSEILEVLSQVSGSKKHFEVIFHSGNQADGASLLMQYFFGIEKIGGTNPKFKILDNQLDKPRILNQLTNLEYSLLEVANYPSTGGISYNSYKKENIIDTIFIS